MTLTAFIGLLSLSPVQVWDMENEDGGFISSGDTEQWEWGEISSGPHSSHDGTHAWATVVDGDYLNDSVDTLQLPAQDLSGLERPVLSFVHWVDIDSEGADLGQVEASLSGVWTAIDPVYGYPGSDGFNGSSEDWEEVYFVLSGVDDLSQIRLRFHADEAVVRSGWVVDDFSLWDGDPIPPSITEVTEVADTQDLLSGPEVTARITDDQIVQSASLLWLTEDGQSGELEMSSKLGELWSATLPAFEPDTIVSWQITATDGDNQSTTDTQIYRVYLPAPTNLSGPDERTIATEVALQWDAPDSDYAVLGYTVYRNGEWATDSEFTSIEVEALDSDDLYTVSGNFDTPVGPREGDLSTALQAEIFIPRVLEINPDHGWPGDQLRLEILGDYLLFSQADSAIDLGDEVALLEAEVDDVDRASFIIEIDEDASPGVLDMVVVSGNLSLNVEDAFTVLSDAQRPTLQSIYPDALEQGDSTTLCIELNTPLEGTAVQVNLGDGVYVENTRSVDTRIWVDVVVAHDAPIGLHSVIVDDGIRLREGVTLRIRDHREPVQAVCASHNPLGNLSPGALLVPGFLFFLRRRKTYPEREPA